MKSPSLNDQACYNETLSASLRAALGEGMGMIGAGMLQDQESAQDLSMKPTGHDGFGSGGFDEAELMMRIKQEVQDVYPDLDFSNPQPLSYHCSPSPQQDDHEHDPKGIEVKGGQMVMMPDVMDHYDNKEEMDEGEEARKEQENEERNAEMEKMVQRKNSSAEYDEESSREQEERQHFEDEEDDCNMDRSRNETEAERELRAVQEKLEREQAEDLRNEYSLLENGYRSKVERNYNRHHHYLSLPTRFSPLNTTDKEDRHRHSSEDQNFLGRSFFQQSGDNRASSMHGSPEALFFASEKPNSQSHNVTDDAKDALSLNTDSSMTRPFIVQLPDSGPVFPTPHHQTVVSRAPSIDITVSGAS